MCGWAKWEVVAVFQTEFRLVWHDDWIMELGLGNAYSWEGVYHYMCGLTLKIAPAMLIVQLWAGFGVWWECERSIVKMGLIDVAQNRRIER